VHDVDLVPAHKPTHLQRRENIVLAPGEIHDRMIDRFESTKDLIRRIQEIRINLHAGSVDAWEHIHVKPATCMQTAVETDVID
jgi:hypothetical protein